MASWVSFLAEVEAFLRGAGRDQPSAESAASRAAPFKVAYDPGRCGPSGPDEILIGVGYWTAGDTAVAHRGVCLNNKGIAGRFGTRYASVTDLALDPPPELAKQWRKLTGDCPDPAALMGRFTLVVEDVGPDSCFGFISWLAVMGGVDAGEIGGTNGAWADAVRRWETTGMCDDPFKSWAALLSALGHSYALPGARPLPGVGRENPLDLTEAWRQGLLFTVHLLRRGIDPEAVPPLENLPAYSRATAFMKGEQLEYRQTLNQAVRLQLRVPMAGTGDARQLLVDAYFAVETWPSGTKKIFVRTDREHTHTGEGFALMGLFRPHESGSGNDMTVSVDPGTGIHLEALWKELERLETEKWAGRRPGKSPRPIASYAERQGYSQPWWDDTGRYTILGAPKRDQGLGIPGTLLGWNDVVEAAWRCYNPLRDLRVIDLLNGGMECPIGACRPQKHRFDKGAEVAVVRYLAAVRWIHSTVEPQSLFLCPTAKRHMVALAIGGTKTATIGAADLPEAEDLEFVPLRGGFALIHEHGVFLFDDWRTDTLNVKALQNEFDSVVQLLGTMRSVGRQIGRLLEDSPDTAKLGKLRNSVTLLSRLSALRAEVAGARQRYAAQGGAEDVLRFRRHLESRWSIENLAEALYTRISHIEDSYRTISALRTQSFVGILASYGLPFFVSSTAFALSSSWIDGAVGGGSGLAAFAKVGGYFALSSLLIILVRMRQRSLAKSAVAGGEAASSCFESGKP